jgi:hypothetical protein
MLLFQSQWLPVTHPVGAPVRPTNTVSTQTVGLFYPSEKGLSNKREEIDKKGFPYLDINSTLDINVEKKSHECLSLKWTYDYTRNKTNLFQD